MLFLGSKHPVLFHSCSLALTRHAPPEGRRLRSKPFPAPLCSPGFPPSRWPWSPRGTERKGNAWKGKAASQETPNAPAWPAPPSTSAQRSPVSGHAESKAAPRPEDRLPGLTPLAEETGFVQALVGPGGWVCFPQLGSCPKPSPAASGRVCDPRAKPERAGAERWPVSFHRAFVPCSPPKPRPAGQRLGIRGVGCDR